MATGAVLLSIVATALYLQNLRESKRKSSTNNNNNTRRRQQQQEEAHQNVDPKIMELFQQSAADSRRLMQQLSNTEKLILYSLYKQSTEGDAPTCDDDEEEESSVGGFSLNIVAKAKRSAWARLRGMNTTNAMIHYIEGVQQLLKTGSIDTDDTDDTTNNLLEGLDDDILDGGGGMMGSTPSTLVDSVEGFGDRNGMTLEQKLLRAASENDTIELERVLNENPNLINHRDDDGQSALHLAADQGATDALLFLLEAGANVSAADDDGITVLHAAVIGENVEACRLLLSHGANPDQADVDGDTPRKSAEEDGSAEMKKLFANF